MSRFGKFIDDFVFSLSPERGLRRISARNRREFSAKRHEVGMALLERRRRELASGGGFASAEKSTDADSWLKSRLSPTSALEMDRPEMCVRADSAIKNFELGTAHVEGRVTRVAGCGMTVDPDLDHDDLGISEDEATAKNKKLRKAWERLAKRIGKHGEWLYEIQQMMQRYWESRGEWFVLIGDEYDPLSPVTLKVEVIDPDRVATPPDKVGDATVRMGVQLNADGKAVGYWIRDTHPGDTIEINENWEYYERFFGNGLERVLHHFERRTAKQHRGYPRMQVGMRRLKNAEEYDEAELERNWEASCQVGVVATDMPSEEAMLSHGVVELSNGERVRDFKPGMFHYVGESDRVEFNNPQGAPASFGSYMEYEGRMFATGAGSAYELLTGKWQGIPYNGARIIWNQEEAIIDVLQMGHTKTIVVIYAHFVTRAVNAGIIDADPVAYRSEPWIYWAMRVIAPARPSVDPSREDRNELVLIESNIKPHGDLVERKTGQPRSEVYRRIARNRAELEEYGLEIHLPNMGRDADGGEGDNSPTQPGDKNQESSDANSERVEG